MKAAKTQTSIALVAALLLAGVSAASAAGMQPSSSEKTAGIKMAPPASDTLSLISAQQKTAWKDLYTGSLNQKAPANLTRPSARPCRTA